MKKLVLSELTSLQKHNYRYSDKYMNNAMIDAVYWRIKCYECGGLVFLYDPGDENYIKCKCGAKKRIPTNIAGFTPEWEKDQRRRDCFEWLFNSPMVKNGM